jgi:hypothetical protein
MHAIEVAVDHLDEKDADQRPAPGHASPRELIHHLADSELHEALNLRRLLLERTPVLSYWDGTHAPERLHYERSIESSLAAFQAVARASIDVLHSLTEEQWRRDGKLQHPWPFTVEDWLEAHVKRVHTGLMLFLNAQSGGRVIADPDDLEAHWLREG